MKRIPFSQVLKNTKIDIRREYARLYNMFFLHKIRESKNKCITLREFCAYYFINLPFRGTCISMIDFDDFYGYHFEENPIDFNLDYLVSFCEYSYNLTFHSEKYAYYGVYTQEVLPQMQCYISQLKEVIEAIGYMSNIQDGITDFVPKDQAAISVAEIVDPNLSYKVIEYNHHSMKGDIERKRATLIVLADKLEPLRSKLKQASASLESDLFLLLNSVNVRHNNSDSSGNKYISYVAAM